MPLFIASTPLSLFSYLSRPTDCYCLHVFNLSKTMNTLDIVALDNIYLCDMHFFYGHQI